MPNIMPILILSFLFLCIKGIAFGFGVLKQKLEEKQNAEIEKIKKLREVESNVRSIGGDYLYHLCEVNFNNQTAFLNSHEYAQLTDDGKQICKEYFAVRGDVSKK